MKKEDPIVDLTLFSDRGPENTTKCFDLVSERVKDLDLDYIVLASTSGETGAKAVDFFRDQEVEVVVVSHQYGFRTDGEIELEDDYRKVIEESGNSTLVITPDVLTRVPKMARGKYQGFSYLDIVADTLRVFSEGLKVCVECVVQAADSGSIPVEEEIAVIAGTGSGADTGVILKSQHSHKLFGIGIRELICMPREG